MKQNTDTRQHIIETGSALIAKKGFSAVGLAEILKTAGVPKGSFYHYFSSKEAFGQAVLQAYFADYIKRLRHLLQDESKTVPERLFIYWQRWMQLEQKGGGCLVVKLSAEVADLSETMRLTLHEGCQKILFLLEDVIAQGQKKSEISSYLDSVQLAHHLYYLWIGASLLERIAHNGESLQLATEQANFLLSMPKEV